MGKGMEIKHIRVEYGMYTKAFSTGAALALFLGMAVIGCSDTAVDSSTSSDDVAFAMYPVDEASLTDLGEVPTEEQVLAKEPAGDPSRDKGGDKNRDNQKEPGRDWGKIKHHSYKRILGQLD